MDELKEIFVYEDGILYWKIQPHPRIKIGDRVGSLNAGYLQVELGGKSYKNHRIIWMMHFGEIPEGFIIDHIDGNPLNNQLSNLRLATSTQNQFNSKKRKGTTSQYKGVTYRKRDSKWYATIQLNNYRFHIGSYNTELEAHEAYCRVASEIAGNFFNKG